MEHKVIELDVGGKLFRTTKSTLCSTDGYFARMLHSENWGDGSDGKPIFIDRDHTVFEGILSYLRTSQVLVSDVVDDMYLKKLMIEADYYQLNQLVDGIKLELSERIRKGAGRTENITQKVVGAPDVAQQLSLGWTYIANYQGNETNACASTGSKVEALWRMNQCTACGENMSYEKFCKHVSFFRPTQVILQRITTTTNIQNSESLSSELNNVGLAFDASFG